MRLLKLDENIQELVMELKISQGHARALLPISDSKIQMEVAEKIIKEELSVREVEQLVKKIIKEQKESNIKKDEKIKQNSKEIYSDISKQLNQILGTKVNIKDNKNKGKIEIEYYSEEELDRLVCLFKKI